MFNTSFRVAGRLIVAASRRRLVSQRYYGCTAASTPLMGRAGRRPLVAQSPFRFPVAHQLKRTMFIQNEVTPNQDAIKFYPGEAVLPSGTGPIEFVNARDSFASPLAKSLFQIDGVKHVFLGGDFITITKDPLATWQLMKPDIYSAIMDFYSSGQPMLTDEQAPSDTAILDDDPEHVKMVKELLDTRIRPAIQEDGGDVEYRGFSEEGIVRLRLKGACRTCDSSVMTLKNGIENMLKHYVPEVNGVEQELDEDEAISQQEFDKLEKRLGESA